MTTACISVSTHVGAGEMLMSRSQARTLAVAIPASGRVELDFAGVERIGPSFADELFRVFLGARPGVTLVPVNMNDAVSNMVRRASAGRIEVRTGPG